MPEVIRPLSSRTRRLLTVLAALGLVIGAARPAYAMHIAEGFLSPLWAGFWFLVCLVAVLCLLGYLQYRWIDQLARAERDRENETLETALDGIGIPLHPGAERFYKEAGLLK